MQQPQTLDFPDLQYPQRPQVFCIKAIRAAIHAGMVVELGPRAFAMFCLVAEREDRLLYRRPPDWTNSQMAAELGIHSDTVEDVRALLVAGGWLYYKKRHRRPGLYWSIVPAAWEESAGLVGPWSVPTPDNTPTKGPDNTPDKGPTLHTHPYPQSHTSNPSSPSALDERSARSAPADPWDAVVMAMMDFGIVDIQAPIESLKKFRVPPALALDVLRHATQTRAWKAGAVHYRLRTLRPGQDPRLRRLWVKPDFPERLPPITSTTPDARTATAAPGERGTRLRQLELQFDSEVRGRPTVEIAAAVSLPEPLRERLLLYARWENIRSDDLRLAVLERFAARRLAQ